jgi:hypothetical protein
MSACLGSWREVEAKCNEHLAGVLEEPDDMAVAMLEREAKGVRSGR